MLAMEVRMAGFVSIPITNSKWNTDQLFLLKSIISFRKKNFHVCCEVYKCNTNFVQYVSIPAGLFTNFQKPLSHEIKNSNLKAYCFSVFSAVQCGRTMKLLTCIEAAHFSYREKYLLQELVCLLCYKMCT